MSNKTNLIKRSDKTRSYRKIFYIATEGRITEREYFDIFRTKNSNIKISFCPRDNKSNPVKLLRKITNYLKDKDFNAIDEAWLVIDKDSWAANDLATVYEWAKSSSNYGVALSAPCFEFWLLLHFEKGHDIHSHDSCLKRLSNYIPNYNKHIDKKLFPYEYINTAIQNSAEKFQNASKNEVPQCTACSTVHILVCNIIQSCK